ncbi:hypothetical protein EUGRSUZ_D02458 [Eucalyptus grandis]|uniref:Protein kinase domain-containing protein n=2 Tax=Eucalyptus grandis TaxID=71139 RepID=A0A059CK12_EUCGR|nr:hypothetical protein EUGRSUZ_D02458 [Eucalyptus grandis]
MAPLLLVYSLLFFLLPRSLAVPAPELAALMAMKSSLDPEGRVLTSWALGADPCDGGSFEGVACDGMGRVTNVSLQGKGLTGRLPAAVGGLRSLTGLYLHFNGLSGEIPKEIGELSSLSDLYLNVNNLSGEIPPEIGNLSNLQVLQLCYNKLEGSLPTQLGSMKKLSVLAFQYNQLAGAIPATLGDLENLTRLDMSFNNLFGSIPTRLADVPLLEFLDIRNNSLSGNVSPALKRLNAGFRYENNYGLCGNGFPDLEICGSPDLINPNRPEAFGPKNHSTKDIPESAKVPSNCSEARCSNPSKSPQASLVVGVIGTIVALTVIGLFAFSAYRRRKQKIGSTFDTSDSRLSTDQVKEVYRRSASPLINLEYSSGWDPLAKGGTGFSQEVFESFMFNLEDVERATHCFSETNLLGKSNFSATYKGILRDGSVVAVKCIAKTSCRTDEAEFLKGLKLLTSLKHTNLVRLRGFCCSKGRGECFLIYEFVANGNLLQYLDVNKGSDKVLEWSTRVSIINGIAEGIKYIHANKGKKPAIVHQNICAEKVLIDHWNNPLLSDSGLHKLLADDIVFSTLKASAAMGYLAPEYTTTGRFTEKSDVYAFGKLVLQIIIGKRNITPGMWQGAENCKFEDFMDPNLEGNFSEREAAKLVAIALRCIQESPFCRPSMENVVQELSRLS